MRFHEHASADELTERVVRRVGTLCAEAIEQRGRAALALAGGSTPLPIYRGLAARPLDWDAVGLLPGDDRWVSIDHPASNRRALQACFGDTSATVLPLVPDRPGPRPDTATARHSLEALPTRFDLCILGMGGDGHFASLFPGAEGLAAALDPEGPDEVITVHPDPMPPDAPFPRISLTLRRLLASRTRLLLIRGDDKREVLERARRGADLPVAALLEHAGDDLDIHWSP